MSLVLILHLIPQSCNLKQFFLNLMEFVHLFACLQVTQSYICTSILTPSSHRKTIHNCKSEMSTLHILLYLMVKCVISEKEPVT